MADKQKIEQLSLVEKSVQSLFMQKQQFQQQILEIDHAMRELESSPKAYKQVGNILVEADAEKLKTELKGKKDIAELRVSTLEKQEAQLREKGKKLQEDLLSSMGEKE